jgi:hypothetical protein
MRATGNIAGQVHALRWKSLALLGSEQSIRLAQEAADLADARLPADDKRTRMQAQASLAATARSPASAGTTSRQPTSPACPTRFSLRPGFGKR